MVLDVALRTSDAMLNAVAHLLGGGGSLELLSGDSQVLVVLPVTDAGAAVDGELEFKLAEGTAVSSGEASFARAVGADGSEVFSCDVGPAGSDCVIRLTPTTITRDAPVRLHSFRLVMP